MMFLKILKIWKFQNRKFRHRIFQNMSTFQLKPRYVVIVGNPIEIDSKLQNCMCCSEKSESQKSYGGILIIFSENIKNVFIISETMFLGQESKYNGKFRAPDSKNLLKPWFFHQKSSKIIDFSWFSLSELPCSKSQQPTCLLGDGSVLHLANSYVFSRFFVFSQIHWNCLKS